MFSHILPKQINTIYFVSRIYIHITTIGKMSAPLIQRV
jgi:hypothetical protein